MNVAKRIAEVLLKDLAGGLPDGRRFQSIDGHPAAEVAWVVVMHREEDARTHGDKRLRHGDEEAGVLLRVGRLSVKAEATAHGRDLFLSMWGFVRVRTTVSENYVIECGTSRVFTRKGAACDEIESKRLHELRFDHRAAVSSVATDRKRDRLDHVDPTSTLALAFERSSLFPKKPLAMLTKGNGNGAHHDEPTEEPRKDCMSKLNPPLLNVGRKSKQKIVEVVEQMLPLDRTKLLAMVRAAGVSVPDDVIVRVNWKDRTSKRDTSPAFVDGDELLLSWETTATVEED